MITFGEKDICLYLSEKDMKRLQANHKRKKSKIPFDDFIQRLMKKTVEDLTHYKK